MELALSLGSETTKPFSFLEKPQKITGKDLGFCMSVGTAGDDDGESNGAGRNKKTGSSDPPVQLNLLPFSPVYRSHPASCNKFSLPWLNQNLGADVGKGLEINLKRNEGDQLELASNNSSPNSTVSSFQMNFSSVFRNASTGKRNFEQVAANNNNNCIELSEADHNRGSDDDEINGSLARKKLRLTKDQSAFLEDSFKEHNTLNPKQKVALAKQLNLRPRQVEVWFQNRRARTKLKQTEVDCEYLKRCCETLTEENKRLQKELSELRALKASHPFYMQLPPTTLTMCPSCERVATTATAAAAAAASPANTATAAANKGSKHFALSPSHSHAHAQPAS